MKVNVSCMTIFLTIFLRYLTDFGSGFRGLALEFRRGPVYGAGVVVGGFFLDLGGGMGFGSARLGSGGLLPLIIHHFFTELEG
jgi:hypothetical protein